MRTTSCSRPFIIASMWFAAESSVAVHPAMLSTRKPSKIPFFCNGSFLRNPSLVSSLFGPRCSLSDGFLLHLPYLVAPSLDRDEILVALEIQKI